MMYFCGPLFCCIPLASHMSIRRIIYSSRIRLCCFNSGFSMCSLHPCRPLSPVVVLCRHSTTQSRSSTHFRKTPTRTPRSSCRCVRGRMSNSALCHVKHVAQHLLPCRTHTHLLVLTLSARTSVNLQHQRNMSYRENSKLAWMSIRFRPYSWRSIPISVLCFTGKPNANKADFLLLLVSCLHDRFVTGPRT